MASGAIYPPSTALATWEYPTGYPHDDYRPEYAPLASSRPLPRYTQYQQAYQTPPHGGAAGNFFLIPFVFWLGPSSRLCPSVRHHLRSFRSRTFLPRRHNERLSAPQSFYFVPPSALSSASTSDSSASTSSVTWTSSAPRTPGRSSDNVHDRLNPPFHSIPATEAPVTLPDEGQLHPHNAKPRPKRRSVHAAEPANRHADATAVVIPSVVEHPLMHEDGAPHLMSSSMPSSIPPPPGPPERPKDGRRRTSSRPNPPDLDSIDELDETNPHGFNLHHRGPYEAIAAILNETNPIDSPLLRVKGIQQQVSANALLHPSRRSQVRILKSTRVYFHAPLECAKCQPFVSELATGANTPKFYVPTDAPASLSLERIPATYPPDHYTHSAPIPADPSTVGYDAVSARSPLRRNQTLPASSSAHALPEQSYHIPPPARPEAHAYKGSYPADSNIYRPHTPPLPVEGQNIAPSQWPDQRQMSQMSRHAPEPLYNSQPPHPHPTQSTARSAKRHSAYPNTFNNTQLPSQPEPVASAVFPEAPPTPDLDQRLSRTLYLTNPDEIPGSPDHRLRTLSLPPAPESVYPSRELRYGGQPPLAILRGTASEETSHRSRRSPPRSSPPAASTHHHQGMPQRYEPPSQTLAAMNGQRVGHAASVTSASSSHMSSSLVPRHIPKRLVMPTPLASTTENTLPMARSGGTGTTLASSRTNGGQPGHLLRKRSAPTVVPPSQRAPAPAPPQTVNRGVLALFGFGKGSKPTVHEVRMTERPKRVINVNEKQQPRVRTQQEPRKLSKRR
ncbi:hypothetical protein B0F90DRAFT_1665120 [Multifurca ochricompacta]|uniref:Uncharacterized protein n=1 Tax=Multifurca ochricompacta TaxID=376703 RepID=A0AAD4MDB1_9AGAM|nr:hypothetical protein B0F90DRAFT_1665120 [Multifurca ochricompacta]